MRRSEPCEIAWGPQKTAGYPTTQQPRTGARRRSAIRFLQPTSVCVGLSRRGGRPVVGPPAGHAQDRCLLPALAGRGATHEPGRSWSVPDRAETMGTEPTVNWMLSPFRRCSAKQSLLERSASQADGSARPGIPRCPPSPRSFEGGYGQGRVWCARVGHP